MVLVHKLRAPGQPEFAIGAIDDRGHVIEGPFMAHVPRDYVQREIHDQRTLLQTRRAQYSRVAPPVDPNPGFSLTDAPQKVILAMGTAGYFDRLAKLMGGTAPAPAAAATATVQR